MNHGCMAMTLKPKPNHQNGKHFATIEEIKRKIETGAFGDTKKRFSEVFRGALCLRGVTLKETR